jgi:hypothetical protein
MKNKILIFCLLLVSLIACSSDDQNEQSQKELEVTVANLEGTWQATESRKNDGSELGPFEPLNESERFVYKFKTTSMVSDTFIECDGTYSLNEETKTLQIMFDCIEEEIIWEVISLKSEELILASQVSEESFRVKFSKIKNQ